MWYQQDTNGDVARNTRKQIRTDPWGYSGRRGQYLGGHLCGHRQGGIRRPPWGETRGKGEGCRPAVKPGWRVLRSRGQGKGARGLRSGTTPHGGYPGSGRGSQVATGHRHPCSGRVATGGRNLQSDPRRRQTSGGGGGWGRGGDGTPPPHYLRNQGARIQRQRREGGGRSKADAAVAPTAGNGGGRQCGDTA